VNIEITKPPVNEKSIQQNALCFEINSINVEGVKVLPDERLEKLLLEYNNRCLSLVDINALLKAITGLYFDRGYVTSRAYLPKQNLSTGTLTIQVIEGVVESFDQTDAATINVNTAFPNMVSNVLNLRNIEQGIEQLNRLSANNIRMELLPGKAIGSTVIRLINNKNRSWQANIRYDNSGQESTGERQARLFGSVDNPFGFNDYLSVSLQADTKSDSDGKKSESASLRYEVPYGDWLYSIDANWFDYLNRVQGQVEVFDTSGKSNRQTFSASRVMQRNQTRKIELISSLTRKSNENFIEDVLLDTSSRTLAIGKLQLRNKYYFSSHRTLQSSITYQRGLPLFGAPSVSSNAAPQSEYDAWLVDVNFSDQWRGKNYTWRYNGQLSAQYSDDVLFGSEKISIGSQYTIRGFKVDSLSSGTGAYFRNDISLSIPIKENVLGFQMLSPFVGLDIGGINGDSESNSDDVISGAAIGARLYGRHFSADMTYGRVLKTPETFSGDKEQLYFSITMKL